MAHHAGQPPGLCPGQAVEIPATIEISTACDGDRQVECLRVHTCDQIGARLAHIVRQHVVITVSLVTRRRHDRTDQGASAGRLEHGPSSANVRVERLDRTPIGDADDRLRREMKNGLAFVFAKEPLEDLLISHVTADQGDVRHHRTGQQITLRNPIANQCHRQRLIRDQPTNAPAAEQSGSAGHQHRPISPECRCAHHVFHAAAPVAQCASKSFTSRSVSIGDQNPSCLKARS